MCTRLRAAGDNLKSQSIIGDHRSRIFRKLPTFKCLQNRGRKLADPQPSIVDYIQQEIGHYWLRSALAEKYKRL